MGETDRPDEISERILDAAQKLFVHYGYDKTTISEIAEAAKISKSTLYLRWKKKEDIFQKLLWRESSRLMLDWFDRIEADPQGGTYGSVMRHAVAAFFENPFLKAIYSNDRRVIGASLQQIGLTDLFLKRMAFFKQFFYSMQQAGVVRSDIDAPTLVYLLNALNFGLMQFSEVIPPEHSPPTEATLTMMVELIERMVTPVNGGDSAAGKAVIRQYRQWMLQSITDLNTAGT